MSIPRKTRFTFATTLDRWALVNGVRIDFEQEYTVEAEHAPAYPTMGDWPAEIKIQSVTVAGYAGWRPYTIDATEEEKLTDAAWDEWHFKYAAAVAGTEHQ